MLKGPDLKALDAALELIEFSCRAVLAGFVDDEEDAACTGLQTIHLIKSVCVRTDLSCCHPMEVPYFSSGAFPRICLTVPLLRTSKSGLGLRGSTQFVALPTSPSWQREKGSSLPNNKACLYSSEAPFFLNNSKTDIIRFIYHAYNPQ